MAGLIIGGGVTGLAAGVASGFQVLEAAAVPGGICSSYYMRPGRADRLPQRPDGPSYRFEVGGGHWIFGGDPVALAYMRALVPMRQYQRRSSVYLRARDKYVAYPLQNHLRSLDAETVARALAEMAEPHAPGRTMKDWLRSSFGATLCELFFDPFHERYTGSLYETIAPQDAYKSPQSLGLAIQGALTGTREVGYNVSYLYPEDGLDALAQRMAASCRIRYGAQVTAIDLERRQVRLANGESIAYEVLVSTLPLNKMLDMSGLQTKAKADPHTSVLVLNVGAVRGPRCPDDHWIYVADSRAPFHRVGFYGNVDESFVPPASLDGRPRTGLYVERAFAGGKQPSDAEVSAYADAVVAELTEWGWIQDVEALDPTWIDVAYTWSWPGSSWRNEAIALLSGRGVQLVGRYARWVFQGIADSVRDGLFAGAAARAMVSRDVRP